MEGIDLVTASFGWCLVIGIYVIMVTAYWLLRGVVQACDDGAFLHAVAGSVKYSREDVQGFLSSPNGIPGVYGLTFGKARLRLDALLEVGGRRVAGGTGLFRYVEMGDAHATWRRFCEHGIYTRRFDWTRSHLRVGLPGRPEAEARLAGALSLER